MIHAEEIVSVRYMVSDVETAVDFYTKHFGFTVGMNAAPAFADVFRGNLRLLLSGPQSSAGRPMPDGRSRRPAAGTASTSSSMTSRGEVERLRAAGCASATTSSAAREASRSCSRTLPGTRSSCFSLPGREPSTVRGANQNAWPPLGLGSPSLRN